MKKILLATLLVGIVGSIFIINDAYAAAGGLPAIISQMTAQLLDHDARISVIEAETTTVVANSQQPSLFSAEFAAVACPILDSSVTNPAETEYVQGWCPDGLHRVYILEDSRLGADSLMLLNLQDPNAAYDGLADCNINTTGDFTVTGITDTISFTNAAILDCSLGPTAPKSTTTLIYAVFN